MSINDPAKRILTEFGEPEEFFGFTISDLQLLVPGIFLAMIVIGNTPEKFQIVGWSLGGGLVLGLLILISAAPGHKSTQGWVIDRIRHLRQPSVLTHIPSSGSGNQRSSLELSPEVEAEDTISGGLAGGGLSKLLHNDRLPSDTQELIGLERFHVGRGAGKRADGYVFGALQVHPANMALATRTDWEQAVTRLGAVVNTIDFPFQIYSTVTPVDPERITKGYRERLKGENSEQTPEFRSLVETYAATFPREFARRGTSVREFYIVIPVSALDVLRQGSMVNQEGFRANMESLPYLGGVVTTIRARRRDVAPEELEHKQVAELDHRLTTIQEEVATLDGCRTARLSTPELAALLKDFWEPGARTDDDPDPFPRTKPVVSGMSTSGGGR